MRYLSLVVLLLLSACIQIGSDPQPLNFYILEAPLEQPRIYSSKYLNIDIHLIDFAKYIDRPQIVTSDAKNSITINEMERWGNPLSDNIVQVVRESLALAFPNSNVTISPWESAPQPVTKLQLTIDKFTGRLGHTTNISIRWKIITPSGKEIPGNFSEQQPIGATFHDLVVGLNDSLIHFNQTIAGQLDNQ